MLSEAKNKMLTQVGPGTPMGEYLRRYWTPIAGTAELDGNPVKAVRIFGEDLTLYRDKGGRYGLVDRNCAHRRADLSYGWVEDEGIRCNYHGWCFSADGRCLEQPYEDTANPGNRLKESCSIKAYPVKACSGIVWAYMGPLPAPELPVWEPFTWINGFVEVVVSDIPCNWLQCQENSCDPVHFEWMHDNWSAQMRGEGNIATKHLRLGFDEFDYGFTYRRIREGADESDALWTVGRVCLWPLGFFLGEHFEWRVPVDDENTLSISWFYTRVPNEREPYIQEHIPTWKSPIKKDDGRWIDSHVMNQDFIAWVGQGTIADRTKEHLGASDRGISMIRNRFFEDIESVAAGHDAKGTIRDPEAAKCVELPIAYPKLFKDGLPAAEWKKNAFLGRRLHRFPWCYGQPQEVLDAFHEALGAKEILAAE